MGGSNPCAHVPTGVLRAEMMRGRRPQWKGGEEEAVLFTTNATQPPGKAWGSRHRTSNAAHPAPRGKNREMTQSSGDAYYVQQRKIYARTEAPLKMSSLDGKTKTKR